jgi:hypothetical protein
VAHRARVSVDERPGDPRLDLGAFGGVVMALLVGLMVLAVVVAALVEMNAWPLALFAAGALALWARLVR